MLMLLHIAAVLSSRAFAQDSGAFGFGSVFVDFETPPGYMYSFRDYLNNLANAPTGGPVLYVENYGPGGETDESIAISFFRLADDLDGDRIPASGFLIDPVTGALIQFHDFDDLHKFNIAFTEVGLARYGGARSLDMVGVTWFGDNQHSQEAKDKAAAVTVGESVRQQARLDSDERMISRSHFGVSHVYLSLPYSSLPFSRFSPFAPPNRHNGVGLAYGFGRIGLWDRFEFLGLGSILGRTHLDTRAENQVFGPQLGLVGVRRWGPFSIYVHGLVTAGYNDALVEQHKSIGEELIPGALNRPLLAQPTSISHGESHHVLSPSGEIWAEAGLRLTEAVSLKFAWTAIFVDNILLTDDRIVYQLPDPGLRDPGRQDYLQQYFLCGIEVLL